MPLLAFRRLVVEQGQEVLEEQLEQPLAWNQ